MAPHTLPARILVIDDDAMSRELLAALLQAQGCAVDTADSGEAALALLDRPIARPNLVLTDLQMPGLTPAQLAGRLRRACGRTTPLVAISGSRPPAATLARFNGFLLKPFTIADLAAAFTTAVDSRHANAPRKKSAAAPTPAPTPAPPHLPAQPAVLLSLHASAPPAASKYGMDVQHATPPSAASAPVLDETIYRRLSVAMPGPQLREMYAMCLSDARDRIASMRSHAAAHDSAQFSRQAHAIKGSCGMLGATELHRIAADLEVHGPAPGSSSVNSLDELSNACDRLERMLGARA